MLAYALAPLKTLQEVVTHIVSAMFSVLYPKTYSAFNQLVGFAFVALGAYEESDWAHGLG